MSLANILLLASILGLVAGPLLLHNRRDPKRWRSLLDGFTIVSVGGLAILHLLPEGIAHGGGWAAIAALIGMLFPVFLERSAARTSGHLEAVFLLLGLIPHALIESAALGAAQSDEVMGLGSAVAAHRLPVGLIIFSMFQHRYGSKQGWVAIAVLVTSTVVGFWTGDSITFTDHGFAWMEAFVGGMLLHVVYSHHLYEGCKHNGHETKPTHDKHEHEHEHEHEHGCHVHSNPQGAPNSNSIVPPFTSSTVWPAIGALIGAAVAGLVINTTDVHQHDHNQGSYFLETFANLALESAPALLIAYILAGLVRVFLTPARTRWMHGKNSPSQALRGVAFGLPLPICSCGVLPLYQTLVKMGVPTTAAMGFLIATPELGIDAILLSVPLLGVELTIARLVAAFAVAMVVAIIVGRLVPSTKTKESPQKEREQLPFSGRLKSGLRFGLVELFDHTMPWIIIGLLIASLAEPLLGHEQLRSLPSGLQVPLFALIGIPVYVCASGATPIAAVAIYQGISPGAALAFLLAGPATNITTFGILTQLHSKKVAIGFGLAVMACAVSAGLAIDQMSLETLTPEHTHDHDHAHGSPVQWLSLIGLGLLLMSSLFRQGPRGIMEQITNPNHEH